MFRIRGRTRVRLSLALGLVVAIASVVLVGRLMGRDSGSATNYYDTTSGPTAVVTTPGDDGPAGPSPVYTDDADVTKVSKEFIDLWIQRELPRGEWHDLLKPLMTLHLAMDLAEVDPRNVPADRVVAVPSIVARTDQYALVTCTVDTGEITLTLVKSDHWMVDGIDWERT